MLKRLHVHNFRCLENFSLALGEERSILLIGRNGAGKSAIGSAIEILQRIARESSVRVADLVKPKDLSRGPNRIPARFEVEVQLASVTYAYSVAFDFPPGFRELRVAEERLMADGRPAFDRRLSQVKLAKAGSEAAFGIDWHLLALPIIQEPSPQGPITVFRRWLADVLVLAPVPSLARGESEQPARQPDKQATNIGAWFSGMVAESPGAYLRVQTYLTEVMRDFRELKNPIIGADARGLEFHFGSDEASVALRLEDLSEGEKCFTVFALLAAANAAYGPLLCFWDEPDNFLAPAEVSPSIMALRRAFQSRGQLILTSNDPEVVRRFADENTLVLYRRSHLEPTESKWLAEMRASGAFDGSAADAVQRGDLPP